MPRVISIKKPDLGDKENDGSKQEDLSAAERMCVRVLAERMSSRNEKGVSTGEELSKAKINGLSYEADCNGNNTAAAKKKARRVCSVDECTNSSQKDGLCDRHGGRPLCSHDGCSNQRVRGGVCVRHGARKPKKFSQEGCTNYVQQGGVGKKNGAKVGTGASSKTPADGISALEPKFQAYDAKDGMQEGCSSEEKSKTTSKGAESTADSTDPPKKKKGRRICSVEECTNLVYCTER